MGHDASVRMLLDAGGDLASRVCVFVCVTERDRERESMCVRGTESKGGGEDLARRRGTWKSRTRGLGATRGSMFPKNGYLKNTTKRVQISTKSMIRAQIVARSDNFRKLLRISQNPMRWRTWRAAGVLGGVALAD